MLASHQALLKAKKGEDNESCEENQINGITIKNATLSTGNETPARRTRPDNQPRRSRSPSSDTPSRSPENQFPIESRQSRTRTRSQERQNPTRTRVDGHTRLLSLDKPLLSNATFSTNIETPARRPRPDNQSRRSRSPSEIQSPRQSPRTRSQSPTENYIGNQIPPITMEPQPLIEQNDASIGFKILAPKQTNQPNPKKYYENWK